MNEEAKTEQSRIANNSQPPKHPHQNSYMPEHNNVFEVPTLFEVVKETERIKQQLAQQCQLAARNRRFAWKLYAMKIEIGTNKIDNPRISIALLNNNTSVIVPHYHLHARL